MSVVGSARSPASRGSSPGGPSTHAPFQALWASTGSGGSHAYFAHPGSSVPNSAGRLGEGLDVRGDGGYVVAPPSLHGCRRPYRWASRSHVATAARHLPPAPAWLVELASPAPAPSHPRHVSS